MPLNVVPVLYYDELVLSQSKTIARFLAKEFGIAGKTNQIQAKADMIIDCITDVENGTLYFGFYHSALFQENNILLANDLHIYLDCMCVHTLTKLRNKSSNVGGSNATPKLAMVPVQVS